MVKKRLSQLLLLGILLSAVMASNAMTRSGTYVTTARTAPPPTSHGQSTLAGGHHLHLADGAAQKPMTVSASELPLLIDGAVTPEAIPDSLAYRHLLSSTTVPDGASDAQRRRQKLLLDRFGLAPVDRQAYLEVVKSLNEELVNIRDDRKAFEAPAAAITATGRHALGMARERERDAFEGARQRLRVVLTQDGAARLNAHVTTHVKSRVKVYGSQTQ